MSGQTWRERLEAVGNAVSDAKRARAEEFKRAIDAGLTYRQVAEASGMSASQVHKIVGTGNTERVSLDSKVGS